MVDDEVDRFFEVLAESTQPGTPPEVLQLLLPPGTYYFGVHLAGATGSPYTLRLLATPSPIPDPPSPSIWINYLVLGDVTPTSAAPGATPRPSGPLAPAVTTST